MKVQFYFLIIFFTLLYSCNSKKTNDTKNTKTLEETISEYSYTEKINCDSLYPNKDCSLIISQIIDAPPLGLSENEKNYLLEFKLGDSFILVDSIFSVVGEVKFEDYNNDNIKDILIQNNSDVRSNWTYNLYLVDTIKSKLVKVNGFNKIKNPRYISKYNLIDNEVMSGRNWTSFYQIQSDSVANFDYVIYKGIDENGKEVKFEKEYNKTLKQVLNNKKYIRNKE